MSDLDFLTNEISIRGRTYRVRELTGQEMAEVRRLTASEIWRVETYVTWKACLEPVFASELVVGKQPQIVIDRVSAEAFRLTKSDEAKEGEPAKND
jgi:hypothetical protein